MIDILPQVIASGILLGGIYAAIAVGFSIVWGVTGIINLAHGSMAIAGAYIAWLLATYAGLDPFLCAPISGLAVFAFGYALQLVLLEQTSRRSLFMTLVFTFGLNMVLINIGLALFSADFHSIAIPYAGRVWELAGVRLPWVRMGAFAVATFLTFGLWWFLRSTRPGQAIQAVAQNPRAAAILGIDPVRVRALAFGLGSGMAGASGALIAMLYPFAPMSGDSFTMKAFVIVILGGLGRIRQALAAAIFLGIVENIVSAYAPGYRDAASFLVLLCVLLTRPGTFPGEVASAAPPSGEVLRIAPWFWLVAGALLLAAPIGLGPYWLRIAASMLKYVVLAQGMNVIAGYTGYPAFGNVVFFGVATYGTGGAMVLAPDLPFWLAMLFGTALCPVVALATGPALLRLKGHTFAIATLGLNQVVRELVANTDVLGGGGGLSLPLTPWAPLINARAFYLMFLAAATLATLAVWAFANSELGLACRAIRDNESKARAMGLRTERCKLLAWLLSATLTGMAGAIDAWWVNFIDPASSFDISIAVNSFIAFLLGGPATVVGPAVGPILLQGLETFTWSHLLTWHIGVMGLLIMAVVTLVPRGIAAALVRLWARSR